MINRTAANLIIIGTDTRVGKLIANHAQYFLDYIN
jgi:dethiobiotin synthetase